MADVRMRGFARRTTVEDALAWVDRQAGSAARASELVPLSAAYGRVLSADITSDLDIPGFDRSMMDGYAVRAVDTQGASAYSPMPLALIGEVLPGQTPTLSLAKGQAIRIMTGAPLPPGADAVLPAEWSDADGALIQATGEVSPGKHVGPRGEDISAGCRVLSVGRQLRPQDVGLLSSIGISQIPVVVRPKVRLVVTGNELLPPGTRPAGFRIADANGPMLAALIARDGGELAGMDRVADQPDAILACLRAPADLVIVSGGSSVGAEDYAASLLAEHGRREIHGIAMRPSSPSGMGVLDGKLVFLLPGNPVSCLCAYDFFAGRAIRLRGGRSAEWPYRRVRRRLARKLVSVVGRVDYARVEILPEGIEPLAISGASLLSSTTEADGFVVIPADSEGYPPGAEVDVWCYDESSRLD